MGAMDSSRIGTAWSKNRTPHAPTKRIEQPASMKAPMEAFKVMVILFMLSSPICPTLKFELANPDSAGARALTALFLLLVSGVWSATLVTAVWGGTKSGAMSIVIWREITEREFILKMEGRAKSLTELARRHPADGQFSVFWLRAKMSCTSGRKRSLPKQMFTFLREITKGQTPNPRQNEHPRTSQCTTLPWSSSG